MHTRLLATILFCDSDLSCTRFSSSLIACIFCQLAYHLWCSLAFVLQIHSQRHVRGSRKERGVPRFRQYPSIIGISGWTSGLRARFRWDEGYDWCSILKVPPFEGSLILNQSNTSKSFVTRPWKSMNEFFLSSLQLSRSLFACTLFCFERKGHFFSHFTRISSLSCGHVGEWRYDKPNSFNLPASCQSRMMMPMRMIEFEFPEDWATHFLFWNISSVENEPSIQFYQDLGIHSKSFP